ncbi:MAG TPA: AAA family ATPase [Vicinamibacterales bacterium]|nr:AAA family ATPase [Acidobacteriota bacterium]HOC18094.1 AAA family ATPase [Vicinamibacterales bacterium]
MSGADGEPDRAERARDLSQRLADHVVGQREALERIVPYLQMYEARLNPPDRPAGIFLLLGPTGTGKTRTAEAVAEVLHGSPKHLLKVDCAEYQSDHEVAKLIGAPPGYVGHRETKPILTQERLLGAVTPGCDLAVVLFDEIEKAAPAFTALLLGILDRGTLRLGDNTAVSFEKSLVFLTSNVGARQMLNVVRPAIGFQGVERRSPASIAARLRSAGMEAVRRRFSPEFVNRLDAVITYRPLDAAALAGILDHHVAELQEHVHSRLRERSFDIVVEPAARELLLARGTSDEFGARELKRTVHRMLTQPLAALVADSGVPPGGAVRVSVSEDGESLALRAEEPAPASPHPAASGPVVLVIDENDDLRRMLGHALSGVGIEPLTAGSAARARELAAAQSPDLLVVDLMLPDGEGLSLALELLAADPRLRVVVTSGAELSADEAALCEQHGFPVLRKPFLPEDAVSLVRAGLQQSKAAGR